MKCKNCGFENKDSAKFCTKCGEGFEVAPPPEDSKNKNTGKYVIFALVIIIILLLVGALGYYMGTINSSNSGIEDIVENQTSQSVSSLETSDDSSEDVQTQSVSSSQSTSASGSKSWVSIGSYSGSGTGSQTISVPPGEIMVKLSAYPIKNYATNYLYVTGSNGQSGGVDWGSHSDVETRYDSFSYSSSSSETFTIDYYETVSWEVEFFVYE